MTPNRTRRHLVGAAGMLVAGLAPVTARAQAQVDTAKVLVGFPPGGTADIISRRLADRLRGSYAKVAVVDNRPGAGGRVAIELLKPAAPDGATLLLSPCSMMYIYPHIYTKLSYNPFEDVTPVSTACSTVFGLAVGPAVPESVRNLPQFVAWCKANPALANYGSPAAGSTPHFLGAMLERAGAMEFRHIAFRGSQPAVLDMLGGQLTSVSAPIGEFLPHLKTGKVRVLASSGTQRSRFMPDVPTYIEQGFKDIEASEPYAVFLPAKASAELVQRAAAAVRQGVAHPEFVEGVAQMGLEPGASTSNELAQILREQHDRWGPIVRSVGFKVES